MGNCAGSEPEKGDFSIQHRAKGVDPDLLKNIKESGGEERVVKIQASIRGHLGRKTAKCQLSNNFDKGDLEINKPEYSSDTINQIRETLAKFHFGDEFATDGKHRVMKPITMLENGSKYEGEWLKTSGEEVRDGRGVLIWLDGSRYEGYWRDNQANGRGRLIHADGDVYEGQWLNDKAHGKGVYTHTDQSEYQGEW